MKENKFSLDEHISNAIYGNTSLEHVFKTVSIETGVSEKEMKSKSRKRERVFARQLYCYCSIRLVKGELGNVSLANIGSVVDKDHATVLHARKTIDNLMDTNKAIRNKVLDTMHKIELQLYKLPKGLVIRVHDPLEFYTKEKLESAIQRIDLFNVEKSFTLLSGESKEVKTGLFVTVPEGYRGEIHTKDSMSIMPEGQNEVIVSVKNDTDFPETIAQNAIIGIFMISKVEEIVLVKLDLV